MIRSNRSLTSSTTAPSRPRFQAGPSAAPLAVPVLDAVAPLGAEADDVVVGAADGTGPALHAVAEAHDGLLLVLVPLVDPGRAEVVAVLAGAPFPAHVLVPDLDVGMPRVLDVAIGEQLVGELLHPRRSLRGGSEAEGRGWEA